MCSAPGEQAWGAKDASRGRGWLVTILLGHSSASCHTPRSLGTLVISLQQLQTAGHLVLQEALVDENLRVSPVSPVSPQPATPKPECPSRQRVPFLRGGNPDPDRSGNKAPEPGRLSLQPPGQDSGSALRARVVWQGKIRSSVLLPDPVPGAAAVGDKDEPGWILLVFHGGAVEPGRNEPGFKSQVHHFPAENLDKLFSLSRLFPHLPYVELYKMSSFSFSLLSFAEL